jgi:hypothetical protein
VESLRSITDILTNFVHALAEHREESLLSARALIRAAIERGVRRGAAIALTMAQAATDMELQDIESFPRRGWETTRTSSRVSSRRRTSLPPLSPRTKSSVRTCRPSLGPLPSPKNVKELFYLRN